MGSRGTAVARIQWTSGAPKVSTRVKFSRHAFSGLLCCDVACCDGPAQIEFCESYLEFIGIPVPLFTAIFALARTVGWIAQLNEMIADPEYKIGRPRQLFVGSAARDVKPIATR